jgi:WD40 repeat protein
LASASADIIGYQENVGYTYSDTNPIQLWDVETGTQKTVLKQDNPVVSMAFSPDGRLLATGDFEGRVHIWDVVSGTEAAVLEAHNAMVVSVAFSPDGKLLATGGEKTVRLWGVPVE